MLFEIHGGNYANKGAQLMIRTTMQMIGEENNSFTMESTKSSRANDLRSIGIRPMLPSWKILPGRLHALKIALNLSTAHLLPRSIAHAIGGERMIDCKALIDVSGYAFGDKWPISKLRNFRRRVDFYERSMKPIVMLPQMFGPFNSVAHSEEMIRIIRKCNLVYARDPVSYAQLQSLNIGTESKVKMAPDITIMSGTRYEVPDDTVLSAFTAERTLGIVPNSKMTEAVGGGWQSSYLEVLTHVSQHATSLGYKVKLILHDEGEKDRKLAGFLKNLMSLDDASVLIERNPITLKELIANTTVLVSSRYHSIVAALSTAIPAITMGWAHKYDELLKDFSVPELLVTTSDPVAEITSHLDALSNIDKYLETRRKIRRARTQLIEQSERMWEEVRAIVLDSEAA